MAYKNEKAEKSDHIETIRMTSEHVKNIQSVLNKHAKQSFFERLTIAFTMLPLLMAVLLVFSGSESVISKSDIQKKVMKLVENNADLTTIKHVFSSEEAISNDIYNKIFGEKFDSYPEAVSLNTVLMDIKSNQFLSEEATNEQLVSRIDFLIVENNKKNPFDSLERGQKDLFENISIKLANQYDLVQPELNKIADEIKLKNAQLRDSDSKSQIGYYVTILSFISALLIAAFQIFQGRSQKIKEIFISAIKEIERTNNT
ncbi:hypothetical protein [Vibrio parahaemolyticus]|uniref:hypothetical protein n=1 Tax=Vibrio TaxID=662 RepID=UPI001C9C2BDC|nr:hypothetical protein [Vibrio parahaemolyticus]ELO1780824.1 hypothetical protein [Vibrio fluvialis]MBY8033012.1 hypothetical protein [Vibrio fluvialis]MBY8192601.1 hypothetical protein [Vibrio fluvialis]MBY8220943.1 hypothetical protein [Vibrio fluvialis]